MLLTREKRHDVTDDDVGVEMRIELPDPSFSGRRTRDNKPR